MSQIILIIFGLIFVMVAFELMNIVFFCLLFWTLLALVEFMALFNKEFRTNFYQKIQYKGIYRLLTIFLFLGTLLICCDLLMAERREEAKSIKGEIATNILDKNHSNQ